MVELKEITIDNYEEALKLKVAAGQENYVSSVVLSLAQAWVYKNTAYPFAIYADHNLVGFIMLGYYELKNQYTLWKLLIDEKYQHKGYGRKALKLGIQWLVEQFEVHEVYTGVAFGNTNAENLYHSLGFRRTGDFDETQLEMKLVVDGSCSIREVTREDIPQCVEVIKKSFQTVADEFGFTEENAPGFTAFSTNEERLTGYLEWEHRPMFVYVEKDKIVGYYSLLLQENKECELNHLAVLPEYRKKGIGRKLFEHSITIAKSHNCTVMNLGIVEENTVLKKWYEDLGCVPVGIHKFEFFPFTCGYMKKNI